MSNITVLDQDTINQIAAGEVIERPSSVVKELLENAIDAGATAITVEIREGGISFIRVTDNGCGIPKSEVEVAFLRHATSKIKSIEDLFLVSSLGFRGEALSSIAAIAQVEVITKVTSSMTGTRYVIEGGEKKTIEEIGAPDGTTFIARNLFFNTPVRRNFLRSPQTEGAHVSEYVEKIALSHPEISIRFIQNNQNKLHTSGNLNVKDMIYSIFGRENAANLLKINCKEGKISVEGYIGKPSIARSNRNYENYFINGRYIKSSLIYKAIEEAYKPFLMQHKYPFTLLHFNIDPALLDVNVHPTKMELRFLESSHLFELIKRALTDALQEKELIPSVELDLKQGKANIEKPISQSKIEPFEKVRSETLFLNEPVVAYQVKPKAQKQKAEMESRKNSEVSHEEKADVSLDLEGSAEKKVDISFTLDGDTKKKEEIIGQQMTLFEEKLLDEKTRARHVFVGQLFKTYWLIEFQDNLYIVDQHAAHEKVLYEKLLLQLKNKEHTCQQINPPIIVSLSSKEENLFKKYFTYFTEIGFEVEYFGGREYAFRGVPGNLYSITKKELLLEMIDGLSEDIPIKKTDLILEKLASMACKAAVKGNRKLSEVEANDLIGQLLELENPYACPHGRPTMIAMSKYELEKKFKRIL